MPRSAATSEQHGQHNEESGQFFLTNKENKLRLQLPSRFFPVVPVCRYRSYLGVNSSTETFLNLLSADVKVSTPLPPFKSFPPHRASGGMLTLVGVEEVATDAVAWHCFFRDSFGLGSDSWFLRQLDIVVPNIDMEVRKTVQHLFERIMKITTWPAGRLRATRIPQRSVRPVVDWAQNRSGFRDVYERRCFVQLKYRRHFKGRGRKAGSNNDTAC